VHYKALFDANIGFILIISIKRAIYSTIGKKLASNQCGGYFITQVGRHLYFICKCFPLIYDIAYLVNDLSCLFTSNGSADREQIVFGNIGSFSVDA